MRQPSCATCRAIRFGLLLAILGAGLVWRSHPGLFPMPQVAPRIALAGIVACLGVLAVLRVLSLRRIKDRIGGHGAPR